VTTDREGASRNPLMEEIVDKRVLRMALEVTRARGANAKMRAEIALLGDKLAVNEQRVALMTQKESMYSLWRVTVRYK